MDELSYTVGGDSNLVSFKSAARVPITSLKAHFKPKQDLHGYSKPWPAGGGKNLYDVVHDTISNYTIINSSFEIVTNEYFALSGYVEVLPSTDYTLSAAMKNTEGSIIVCRYDENKEHIGERLRATYTANKTSLSFTTQANCKYIRFCGAKVSSNDSAHLLFDTFQLEKGSAATSYEPYENICPIEGWTEVEQYYSGKNMGHIVGYSASATVNREKTNTYGTTINTIDYEGIHGEVIVTQTQAPELNSVNHYKNGYMVFYPDNLIWDQKYDISFKVSNIISNPLNTTINNFKLISPYGNQALPIKVVEDKLYFKNVLNKQKTNEPSLTGFDIRICGMSCTISDIMITPADSNEEEYEPYTQKRFVTWNQWLKPLTAENWQAYNSNYINTTFENGTATSTWLTNNSGYGTSIKNITGVLQKNKEIWYISYMLKSSMSGGNWGIEYNGGFQNTLVNNLDADTWTRCSECSIYWRGTRNYVYISYYRSGINEHTGMVAQVKSPIFINLTQMFGPGNEPTKEEFEEQCTLNGIDLTTPLPYNEGSIREWKTNGALLKNDIIFPVLGKNKFNINVPFVEPNDTAQSSNTNRIFQPYTYCLGLNGANQYLPDRASNTSYGVLFAIPLLYGTYRISYTGENVSITLVRYNDNGEVLISGNSSIDSQGIFANGPGVSITGVIFRSVTANEPTIVSNIQIEEGIISTQYEEFDSKHTVYGGYVDVITGDVVAEQMCFTFKCSDSNQITELTNTKRLRFATEVPLKGEGVTKAGITYCDKLPYVYTNDDSPHYYSTTNNPRGYLYVNVPIDAADNDEYTFVVSLYTPQVITKISTTQLSTFLNHNNFWSNTNDITEVSYAIHDTAPIRAAKHRIAANEPHVETIDSSLAHFETDMVAPLKECKIYFNPIQDLHGYSEPWPGGGGKNLFNWNVPLQNPDNTGADNTNKRIFIPNTYFVGASYSNYWHPERIDSYSIDNGSITVSSVSGYGVGFAISVTSGDYRISATITSGEGAYNAILYKTDGTPVILENGGGTVRFTVPDDVNIAVIIFRSASGGGSVTFTNIQVEKGTSSTAYEPYENICPITGWTSLQIHSAGKNLLRLPVMTRTNSGITWTVHENGSIDIDGTSTSQYSFMSNWNDVNLHKTFYLKAGTYKLSGNNNKIASMYLVARDGSTNKDIGAIGRHDSTSTFTLAQDTLVGFQVAVAQVDGEIHATFRPQLELIEVSEFESPHYNTVDMNWDDSVGTVYGGYIDLLNGELVQTHICSTITRASNYDEGNNGFWYTTAAGLNIPGIASTNDSLICNRLNQDTNVGGNSAEGLITCYGNQIIRWKEHRDMTLEEYNTYLINNPLIICYKIATSIHHQLSPKTLKTLRGQNNIWSNSNGNVSVKYWAH